MRMLFRSQVSAFIASVVDLLVMIFLVEGASFAPRFANIGGNVTGGVVNFLLNRQWTFLATDGRITRQAVRYVLVWIGYIALSYAAIVIGTRWLGFHYLLVKVVSAVALGLGYNYVLHKHFVYG